MRNVQNVAISVWRKFNVITPLVKRSWIECLTVIFYHTIHDTFVEMGNLFEIFNNINLVI